VATSTPPPRIAPRSYCNPPYTWDSQHKKIYKPSCL
jgi:hypothetical protein